MTPGKLEVTCGGKRERREEEEWERVRAAEFRIKK
jgi:hypothetical protein